MITRCKDQADKEAELKIENLHEQLEAEKAATQRLYEAREAEIRQVRDDKEAEMQREHDAEKERMQQEYEAKRHETLAELDECHKNSAGLESQISAMKVFFFGCSVCFGQ